MAVAFIAQSVASAIIENLVNKCLSYLEAYPVLRGVQDELKRLHNALPLVEAVLTAVEECAPAMMQNKGLDRWLWQLRDAVENAEDVLDELEYYELEKTVQNRDDKVRGILSKFRTKVGSFVNCIFSDDTLKQLREAVKVLDNVVDRIEPFLQIATGLYGPSIKRQKLEEVKNSRESSCLLTESEVLGRDKEREHIVKWLIKPVDGESEGITFNFSAFTIVGMGGLGKTTLAQLICQDERVQGNFDLTMWVCVSQDFDAATITSKMLAAIEIEEAKKNGKAINTGGSGNKHYLNTLHEIVKEKLTSKRFLLILDDVWNDDINYMTEWEKLVAPLKFGQRGSKILLTTRMDSVADMAAKVMKCKRESLNLNELEEIDCMSLFNKHAFLGVNPDDRKNLQPIGEQIVKKLGGCPLVIKVMGGLLNSSKDYDSWERFLKEDTMKLQQGKDSIMTVLRLSYDHLPTNLRVCFRYCSIFPQDYEFKRKQLVYMWMGSGLISQSICGGQSPEDIGREYLDLLTRKSFFTYNKSFKRYVMHDLMHDLAQSVSLGECIRIRGDVVGNSIPLTVRHLSFEPINLHSIEEIPNLKNLRTLVISDKGRLKKNEDYLPVFNKVINGFKTLRLLSLRVSFKYNKLPDALDSLIHLRYLFILSYFTTYESFHFQSLYRLYHLVVMKLYFGGIAPMNIEYDGLTNLVNLRSLDVPDDLIGNIPYLSKLPFIRKLKNFSVREESGYKISELKNLRDLRHLSIRRLENVTNSEEVMEAKLKEKEYLKSLTLEWSKRRSNNVKTDEQLLDNLCPHINFKSLYIKEYQGVKSPHWMTDPSCINLTFIQLINCKGLVHLPSLGGLPSLNGLRMMGLHSVKQIGCSFYGCGGGCAFPSLKELYFEDMPNLEEWIGIDDCCMFPKLHTMKIIRCPNLKGLPALPRCLNELLITDVGLTTLPAINENCGNNNQQEQFPALQTLTIERCKKLQYLPTEFFKKFNTIKDLNFGDLPNLEEWIGIDDECIFPKLRTMRINDCPNLSILPTLPCSLRKLHISNVGLTALPAINEDCGNNNQQDHFQGLEYLTIEQCDKLEYIPTEFVQKFNTVKFLKIGKCPKLTTFGIPDIRPPSVLNEISIGSCGDLEVWSAYLTSLTNLELVDYASMTSLPPAQVCARWTTLSHLEIKSCKELLSFGGIQALVSLHELEIRGCNKLIEVALRQPPFPNDVGRRNAADCFLKLGKLSIDHHALLLMEPLRSLSSISSFTISDASRLTSLPEEWLLQNHSALKELEIWNACSLQTLPQSMTKLCSLEILDVENGKLIQSLPDLPTSLHTLRISGCHPGLKERCQKNTGLDWPKIANIPNVRIDNYFQRTN